MSYPIKHMAFGVIKMAAGEVVRATLPGVGFFRLLDQALFSPHIALSIVPSSRLDLGDLRC